MHQPIKIADKWPVRRTRWSRLWSDSRRLGDMYASASHVVIKSTAYATQACTGTSRKDFIDRHTYSRSRRVPLVGDLRVDLIILQHPLGFSTEEGLPYAVA